MQAVNSILLIEQYGLGDGILSTAALELLRRDFPQSRKVSFGNRVIAELRQDCTLVEKVLTEFPEGETFDLAVDLTGKFRTARWARRSGATIRVGTPWWPSRRWAGRFYTHQVSQPEHGHVLDHKLELARAAAWACGLTSRRYTERRTKIWLSEAAHEFARAWLAERDLLTAERLVAMHCGGASRGRSWRAGRFAQVCRNLHERHAAQILLVGGSEELRIALEVARLAGGDPWVVAGQTSIGQLGALMARCRLFIGGDSGPMHLATAVGLPVVAIFGRSDPTWSGPWGEGHLIVRAELDCSPCRGMPHHRWWQRCRTYRCLDQISTDQVTAAVERMLASTATPVLAGKR